MNPVNKILLLTILIINHSYADLANSDFSLDEDGWASGKWSTVTSSDGLQTNNPYLLLNVDEQQGRKKPIIYNIDSQWTGNLIQKNADHVTLDIKNDSPYYNLYMRVAVGDVLNPMGGTWFVSKESILINTDSVWTNISLSMLEEDLEKAGSADVNGSAGPLTYQEVLSDVYAIRIISQTANKNATAENFYGDVFIDNIYFWKENSVELPIKFDSEEKFEGKGGFQFALSTDPDDSSNNTGKITTSPEWWDTAEITLDVPIEIVQGSDNNVSVRFYSPNDDKHRLLMKIENVVDPSDNSKNTFLELSNEVSSKGWHDLTYDWSTKTTQNYPNDNQPFDGTGSFERLIFFIDAGSPDWCGDCGTSFGQTLDFHIDDIIKGVPAVAPVAKKAGSVISDFEVDGALDSFDGGQTEVIDNPDTNGNSSDKVLKLVKNSGAVWAGHKFIVTDKFNFATEQKIKIKMWSPRVGLKLNLKIEDEVPWPDVSATSTITGTSTVANEWEEIEFDFSGDSKLTADDWYNLVFIIDEGTMGDGTSNFTIYIDDITQN